MHRARQGTDLLQLAQGLDERLHRLDAVDNAMLDHPIQTQGRKAGEAVTSNLAKPDRAEARLLQHIGASGVQYLWCW